MSTRKLYWLTLLVGIFLAGCSATLRESPGPQAGIDPGASVSNAPAQVANSAPSGGPQEGIKVHGHWTIEVRNPDGTLADRREFENALSAGVGGGFGDLILAQFLGRQFSVGRWSIHLDGSAPPCAGGTLATGGLCLIVENADPLTGTNVFKPLTVSVPTSPTDPNKNKLVLAGTATALATGNVSRVFTAVVQCVATLAPSTPCGGTAAFFTDTSLPTTTTPIQPVVNVSPGQIIQVTVVISFS